MNQPSFGRYLIDHLDKISSILAVLVSGIVAIAATQGRWFSSRSDHWKRMLNQARVKAALTLMQAVAERYNELSEANGMLTSFRSPDVSTRAGDAEAVGKHDVLEGQPDRGLVQRRCWCGISPIFGQDKTLRRAPSSLPTVRYRPQFRLRFRKGIRPGKYL